MFQTMNVEAVRTASEVSGLLQREASQQELLVDRMAEAQGSVPEIPRTEGLRAEERQGQGREGGEHPHPHRSAGQEPDADAADTASPAEGHLDFLA
jgi:hypothetical protein